MEFRGYCSGDPAKSYLICLESFLYFRAFTVQNPVNSSRFVWSQTYFLSNSDQSGASEISLEELFSLDLLGVFLGIGRKSSQIKKTSVLSFVTLLSTPLSMNFRTLVQTWIKCKIFLGCLPASLTLRLYTCGQRSVRNLFTKQSKIIRESLG